NPELDWLGDVGHSVGGKLSKVRRLGGEYEVIAVHRDADQMGREARLEEIRSAVQKHMPECVHVPVIPVRMTEAWLLVDESAIRRVATNPNGTRRLELPPLRRVEALSDPKAKLKQVLADASELSGRRLQQFNRRFSENRRQLLQRLDPEGPVSRLPSWQSFVHDLKDALDRLDY
ncbi:DUF4276 family protein, partial [Nocardiopsis chromatogenes]|uniref:DUF4276 family protein n=1 Tax=Nocardiopsis chromatogenes TaxID=280239 RepID=UPI00036AE7DF